MGVRGTRNPPRPETDTMATEITAEELNAVFEALRSYKGEFWHPHMGESRRSGGWVRKEPLEGEIFWTLRIDYIRIDQILSRLRTLKKVGWHRDPVTRFEWFCPLS